MTVTQKHSEPLPVPVHVKYKGHGISPSLSMREHCSGNMRNPWPVNYGWQHGKAELIKGLADAVCPLCSYPKGSWKRWGVCGLRYILSL